MTNLSDASSADVAHDVTCLDLDVTELDTRLEMSPIGIQPDWWIGGGAD